MRSIIYCIILVTARGTENRGRSRDSRSSWQIFLHHHIGEVLYDLRRYSVYSPIRC